MIFEQTEQSERDNPWIILDIDTINQTENATSNVPATFLITKVTNPRNTITDHHSGQQPIQINNLSYVVGFINKNPDDTSHKGNICYMNAVVQCFVPLKSFNRHFVTITGNNVAISVQFTKPFSIAYASMLSEIFQRNRIQLSLDNIKQAVGNVV